MEAATADSSHAPRGHLSLWDASSIMVGIIIGAGLYEGTPTVANQLGSTSQLILVWALGGALTFVGALCYAELATSHSDHGGDYVYLRAAFGRPLAFLFAWMQFWVVRPGSVGALACVFGNYATQLLPWGEHSLRNYALGSILGLTLINVLGVRVGKTAQNLLTAGKLLGLLAVIGIGFLAQGPTAGAPIQPPGGGGFRLASILILFAYAGWNDMAFVAAEVRAPERNLLRALLLGTATVTGVYLLANLSFVHALGLQGFRDSQAVAADVAGLAFSGADAAVSALICVSTLGAVNGQLFTGARIYAALGSDVRWFAPLARWHAQTRSPIAALLAQGLVTVALILAADLLSGAAADSSFEQLVVFTAPVFWAFLLLVGVALIVLRLRGRTASASFRDPFFPLLPGLFCASCSWMCYSSTAYALQNQHAAALWTLALLHVGVLLAAIDWFQRRS